MAKFIGSMIYSGILCAVYINYLSNLRSKRQKH